MANAVAKSGLFGIKTADQAMALMLIAQAEGMHPAIAARDYHVIQGRPALKADAMLARFQAAGGKVEWTKYTDEAVAAKLSHPQGGSVEIAWTITMAERAGLTKNQTWRQYPRQMLRARVISEGIRTVFPGVAVGVYTPEEVQDFDAPAPAMKVVEEVTPPTKHKAAEPQGGKTDAWVKKAHAELDVIETAEGLFDWNQRNGKWVEKLRDAAPAEHQRMMDRLALMADHFTPVGMAAE
jgi:hypothetical protein